MPDAGENDFADIPAHVSEEGDVEEDGAATPRGDEASGGANEGLIQEEEDLDKETEDDLEHAENRKREAEANGGHHRLRQKTAPENT
eukprot:8581151-Alexandrium_andersonii.AAC.1